MKHNTTAIQACPPRARAFLGKTRGLLSLPRFLLLFLLLGAATVQDGFAGCDGFGGTGGGCGTGGDVIYYTVTNGLVTITGVTGFNDQEVIIPTNGLPVVSIAPYAFFGSGPTKVVIPDTVTNIGARAFYNCYMITNVTMGNGLTQIGDEAFRGCGWNGGWHQVFIPASVTTIGNLAFADCPIWDIAVDPLNSHFTSLNGVLFTKDMTTLIQCPAVKFGSYLMPNSVMNILDRAFSFTSLTDITIGNAVTNLGNGAFAASSYLTTVSLGQSLIKIGDAAFQQCDGLGDVTIPDSVTSIGDEAFDRCRNLTNITISGNATNIGQLAFRLCWSLVSVAIPKSVTSIGAGAFSGCYNLTRVTIGNNVTNIGQRAFASCGSLFNIEIPASVNTIGDSAFSDCSILSRVYFGGDAPSLGSPNLFSGADVVTVYYLPGTEGWGATFGGRPTAPCLLPNPRILSLAPSFGMQTNVFGFRVSWATNVPVVVEACTELTTPLWTPLTTNSLAPVGWFQFSDPEWTNYPSRLYRVRSQ
jgi:hypothetical protein